MRSPASGHVWKFFRTGGFDQVSLETGADLLALDQLDQKLWVALGCPVKGLELDEKTLALIDRDNDGRISAPDVIAAVKWASARLNDAGSLLQGDAPLPLTAVNGGTPEGQVLVASARRVLAGLGRAEAAEISVADAAESAKVLAANPLVGDGIIPAAATEDAAVQALINEVIASRGGTKRSDGTVGITAGMIGDFYAELAAYVAWNEQGAGKQIAVLGEATESACQAVAAIRAKLEDYFARTRLATFDPRSVAALNRSETDYLAVAAKDMTISADEIRALPLARIEPGRALPLTDGTNPAWTAELAALRDRAVTPVFGHEKSSLTAEEWAGLNATLAPYETWRGQNAGRTVEKLGLARARELLAGDSRAALTALISRDQKLAPEFKAISDVERLARYYRDLRTLLHNFVNFGDFYSPERAAAFQAGTLYLDSRSTELCIRVDGANPLAAMSKAYVAYCACTRADGAKMTIAACFTQGDSDFLFVGRNGLFYDRRGILWYAVITSIVDNPISIRQAFWLPYKKFLRMIEEQVAKRAAAADAATSGKLAGAAEKTANVDKAKPEPKKVDLALITGIGVAIGSIGTFIATVFAKVVDIPSWQIPLILLGLMLVISLPSMFIAALKLRHRTIGPILEGNGWAVNGRVKINIPFGAALTKMATLPPGARRSLEDPYEDKEAKRRKRLAWLLTVLVILAAAAIWIRWDHNRRGHYFWQPEPVAEPAPAAAPSEPAATPSAPAVTPAEAQKS
ncbi:hypothetical protein [Opitutus terrae]|uniref:EF-hand domain-containing protein n=1 Tax=Opitutus terrae (strain DSM 11246 / JCM 15787 / PB90-1) TaxID=452637 RepID=B1ZZF3_OPITP|nr:hypothetical protein [Opitutus terrae]ACB76356.1 conserved hypothetical protein [Opitutus terrae PB90-1]